MLLAPMHQRIPYQRRTRWGSMKEITLKNQLRVLVMKQQLAQAGQVFTRCTGGIG